MLVFDLLNWLRLVDVYTSILIYKLADIYERWFLMLKKKKYMIV